MDTIKELTGLLASNPREVLIAILLFVVAWLYRDGRAREAAHLGSVMTIAPLASKLAECVGILERVTSSILASRNPPNPPTNPGV